MEILEKESATAMQQPDFRDTEIAFQYKTNRELNLSYRLFKLFGKSYLVKIFTSITLLGLKWRLPIKWVIKNTVFKQFCGGETIEQTLKVIARLKRYGVYTVLDYAAEAQHKESGFDRVKIVIINNICLAPYQKNIRFISLKITGIAHTFILAKLAQKIELDPEETISFQSSLKRLDEICRTARKYNVVIYIDAEESWIQDPIDEMVDNMMKKYNTQKAIVFNTYQMYRTDRLKVIGALINRARRENFIAGIKTVRGAYLEKEQKRALELGYNCPVFYTKAETDMNFNEATYLCLNNLDSVELCLASHNESSTRLLTECMYERGLEPDSHKIYFSQLFGMSDNISFNLADAGYNVSKYLPYGPIETTLPYLIRRAEENSSINGQLGREAAMIKKELLRRRTNH